MNNLKLSDIKVKLPFNIQKGMYYSQYNKDHPSRRFDEPEEALEAAFKEFFEEILITKSQLN